MKKKLISALLFLVVPLFFSACDMTGTIWFEYNFVNNTKYSVHITLNEEYATDISSTKDKSRDTKPTIYNRPFHLYSRSNETVYILGGASVDFSWTSSSPSDNRYIYVVSNGNAVTFKERQK